MHFVKQFNINGVDTKQVACIELQGKPNAATEGALGVLGIDMTSPLHEVYKCVAVNGSIYTWELLSSGLSIMSAKVSRLGEELVEFPYDDLRIPEFYVVKVGDLILDKEGYLYQIDSLNTTYCVAKYCGAHIVADKSAYGYAVEGGYTGTESEFRAKLAAEWVPLTRKVNGKPLNEDITLSVEDVGASPSGHKHTTSDITDFSHNHDDSYYTEAEIDGMLANGVKIQTGTYVGTDRGTGALVPVTLNLNFTPKVVFLQWESGTEADDNQTVSEVYFVQGGNASIVHYVSKSVIANYAPVRASYTISNNTLTINGAGRNESNSINYYRLTYRYIALGEGV